MKKYYILTQPNFIFILIIGSLFLLVFSCSKSKEIIPFELKDYEYTFYDTNDGLSAMKIFDITKDNNGLHWFGTNKGFSSFDGKSWINYNEIEGVNINYVPVIMKDSKGVLWFGTSYYGLFCFDGTKWNNITVADGLSSNIILSISEDHNGSIWVGTINGLNMYDGSKWINYYDNHGPISNNISCICPLQNNGIWFGTNKGVSKYDYTNWYPYTDLHGLPDNRTNTIVEASNSEVWFGTASGLAKYTEGEKFESYSISSGNGIYNVMASAEDKQANLWFGGWEELVVVKENHMYNFSNEKWLINNQINDIWIDDNNTLWVGTDNGLVKLVLYSN